MLARDAVIAALKDADLGARIVEHTAAVIDAIENHLVCVNTDSVAPSSTNPLHAWVWTFGLEVVVPYEDPKRAERELDRLLGKVLDAIDRADGLTWTTAERALLVGRRHKFDVTVTATFEKETA